MKCLHHLAVLLGLALVASAEASLIRLPVPVRTTVVKAAPECRDAYLVSSTEGYQLIEWLAGDVPAVGQVLDGMWDSAGYQFVKMVGTELQSKIFVYTSPMPLAQVNMILQDRCDLWRD
jgi:hypothetical protein